MKCDDIRITLQIETLRFTPTKWTGERGQKPNYETIQKWETETMSVVEAIKYLSKYL